MEPKINKIINPKTPEFFGKVARTREREGFCTEAALLVLPPHRPQLVSGAHSGLALDGSDRAEAEVQSTEVNEHESGRAVVRMRPVQAPEKAKAVLDKSALGAAITRTAPPPRRRLPLGARLTRRLKLDPRSSKRDLRTRCAALAVVSSRRRPRLEGLNPRVADGMVHRTSPPMQMSYARDSRRLEGAVRFRLFSRAG